MSVKNEEEKLSVAQLYRMYHENDDDNDFHDYVDKYCKSKDIPLHTAMLHSIVEIKARDILGKLKVGDTNYV